MTEDEAKKKWCPQARAQTADTNEAPAVNRTLQGAPDIGCHCIGSACMAWRWIGVRRNDDVGVAKDYISEDAARDARARVYHNQNVAFLGCCGLAGKS